MPRIEVTRPQRAELQRRGVFAWPIWTKEASTFPWHYDERETCYLLQGKVRVAPETGPPVEFGAGDMVVFPAGMSCTWTITEPVRKHYTFG